MSSHRPGHDDGRPRFPDIEEEIGEDPGRFLDVGGQTLDARLEGIDSIDVARRWIEVEVELGDYREDSPRQDIIARLNARIEHLREHGDREEQLRRKRGIEVHPDRNVAFVDEDGERYSAEAWERQRRGPQVGGGGEQAREPQEPDDVDEPEQAQEPQEADGVDAADLGGHNEAIYRHVERKGPVSLAELQGKMTHRDLTLEAVEGLIGFLVDEGYLAEVEPETYDAP